MMEKNIIVRWFVILILQLYFSFAMMAQDKLKIGIVEKKDSTPYYTDLSNMYNINLFTSFDNNLFTIYNRKEDRKLDLNGFFRNSVGATFQHKWISLSAGYDLIKGNRSDVYERVKKFDVQLFSVMKKFTIDLTLNAQLGLIVSNTRDLYPDWDKKEPLFLSDIRLLNYKASMFYIFNHKKFSLKPGYTYTTIQNRSAGSFLAGVFTTFHDLTNTSGFVPDEMKDDLSLFYRMRKLRSKSLGVSAGYSYTFVLPKKWFVNVGATPGVGLEWFWAKDLNDKIVSESNFQPVVKLQASTCVGWNGKLFYSGFYGRYQNYIISNDEAPSFSYRLINIEFITGYRFNCSKKKK